MPYCPKCGSKVDENMAFCPTCGASLKGAPQAPPAAAPPMPPRNEKDEKSREKSEKHTGGEKGEKPEKADYSFVGFLVGGLVLVTIGVFALLDLAYPGVLNSTTDLAAMLLIIGVIIIIAAIYIATRARRRFPNTT
jgi:hypothetical protein